MVEIVFAVVAVVVVLLVVIFGLSALIWEGQTRLIRYFEIDDAVKRATFVRSNVGKGYTEEDAQRAESHARRLARSRAERLDG